MKKVLSHQLKSYYKSAAVILLFSCNSYIAYGQFTNTPEGRLALLCKTWGMVRYYHTEVKIRNVNWDSVLVAHVYNIRNAATLIDFNSEMNSLVAAAGVMQPTGSPSIPNMPINIDFSWIPDPMLDSSLQSKLQFIKNNFVADYNYYVFYDDSSTPNDTFPVLENRFLYMFKYWNIINYYFPYRHDMDVLWDQSLIDLIPSFDTATSALSYHLAFAKLNARLNDSHAGKISSDILNTYFNYYAPMAPVNIRRLNNQNVVFRMFDTIPGLHEGDIIHKINGMDLDSLLAEFRKYYSVSNDAFADLMGLRRLLQTYGNPSVQFEAEDSTGATSTVTVNATMNYSSMSDSIYSCSWCGTSYQLTTCGYGYVNMGKLQPAEVTGMYNALKNAPAIIFDLRNYPNMTAWSIANLMFSANTDYARFHSPRPNFPGDYTQDSSFIGYFGNLTPYLGKIFILINEVTISQAEYSAMMLGQSPCASSTKIIGSTTSAADGDVCSFHLPGDLGFAFSGLGVYYPDSTVTQRVGIVPDTVVIPTPAGIRHGIDEVLMAAFDCLTGMNDYQDNELSFNVYPNPGDGIFNLQLNYRNSEHVRIVVYDITARIIYERTYNKPGEQFNEIIDIRNFNNGVYLMKVTADDHSLGTKIILKQK